MTAFPLWAPLALVGLMIVSMTIYVPFNEPGVTHLMAGRTFVFWALVTAPLAALIDVVMQTIVDYPFVRSRIERLKQLAK